MASYQLVFSQFFKKMLIFKTLKKNMVTKKEQGY